jgi:hypothetical protein
MLYQKDQMVLLDQKQSMQYLMDLLVLLVHEHLKVQMHQLVLLVQILSMLYQKDLLVLLDPKLSKQHQMVL